MRARTRSSRSRSCWRRRSRPTAMPSTGMSPSRCCSSPPSRCCSAPTARCADRGLVMLGALFGATLLMEYPAAMVVAALGCWTLALLWRSREPARLAWIALGAAPFLALLALYDHAAYGTLLPTGYEHSTLWQDRHSEGFLSLTYPEGGCAVGHHLRGLPRPLLPRACAAPRRPRFRRLVACGAGSGGVVGRALRPRAVLPLRRRVGDVVGRFRRRAALSPADAPVLLLPDRRADPGLRAAVADRRRCGRAGPALPHACLDATARRPGVSARYAPSSADAVRLAASGRRRYRAQSRHGGGSAQPVEPRAARDRASSLLGGLELACDGAWKRERAMEGTTVEAQYVRP